MAAPLTDRQKKHLIADYAECGNYSTVARKHNVAVNTVKNAVLADSNSAKLCKAKKDQNTRDMLSYLEDRKGQVQGTLDKILAEIGRPEKIKKASLQQLATTYAILIDKTTQNTVAKDDSKLDRLLEEIDREAQR